MRSRCGDCGHVFDDGREHFLDASTIFDDDYEACEYLTAGHPLPSARCPRNIDEDDDGEPIVCGALAYPVLGDGMNAEQQVREALDRLREARELLKLADAPRAAERVRLALTSAQGAHRNAVHRALRAEEPTACECDNTHEAVGTVCRWCWARGRRAPTDPEVTAP